MPEKNKSSFKSLAKNEDGFFLYVPTFERWMGVPTLFPVQYQPAPYFQ